MQYCINKHFLHTRNFNYLEYFDTNFSIFMETLNICKKKRATSWQNQQNDLCTQQRLKSSWASAQSDQSLRCLHEETLGPQLLIECTVKPVQTEQMPRLLCVFTGCTDHFFWFCHEAAHLQKKKSFLLWWINLQKINTAWRELFFHLNIEHLVCNSSKT